MTAPVTPRHAVLRFAMSLGMTLADERARRWAKQDTALIVGWCAIAGILALAEQSWIMVAIATLTAILRLWVLRDRLKSLNRLSELRGMSGENDA